MGVYLALWIASFQLFFSEYDDKYSIFGAFLMNVFASIAMIRKKPTIGYQLKVQDIPDKDEVYNQSRIRCDYNEEKRIRSLY